MEFGQDHLVNYSNFLINEIKSLKTLNLKKLNQIKIEEKD